ncbi:cyclase family protein [Brevibacterium sp. 5221]|uniref:Cyclase family protein n=1 Tax=Brevibacterium rongguiense TaxID=2695267 RepID=A0A6N9H406_9MICO|nr:MULTISPECIES: cyclase family protein [Brevibacterium]MYM18561.1 cyclase family protein [Brevibacterium rongguiense]WAL39632.1 cyclase family protein [Brevibacterium sp. BRM-1]
MADNTAAVTELFSALHSLTSYDVSPTLDTNLPGWFTHPTMGIVRDGRNFDQHGYFAQTLLISEHTGSHVDAPRHIHPGSETIEDFGPDVLFAPYKKYDLTRFELEAGVPVTLEQIEQVEREDGIELREGDIAILQFGWDQYLKPDSHDPEERGWWGANEPGLTDEACKHFADRKIRAIGADSAAVDIVIKDGKLTDAPGHAVHFLPNRILIIEGLVNLGAPPVEGAFFAMPLKIDGGSGSPIRAAMFG